MANMQDVGASYGFWAVASLFSYRLEIPKRRRYVLILLAISGMILAIDYGFRDWAHLSAILIGLSCYRIIPRERRYKKV